MGSISSKGVICGIDKAEFLTKDNRLHQREQCTHIHTYMKSNISRILAEGAKCFSLPGEKILESLQYDLWLEIS